MRTGTALVTALLLAALALLHVYWACDGKITAGAAVPESHGRPAFSPSRAATALVAGCLAAAAYVVAVAGGLLSSPLAPLARVASFALALLLLARAVGDFRLVGFFKRVRGSRFARLDTAVYSPLCLMLGLAAAYVAYHDV
jgi:hypothetical protein